LKTLLAIILTIAIYIESSPATIYNSIDPSSLSKHLAFYKLYPDTPEGDKAWEHICSLLTGSPQNIDISITDSAIHSIVNLSTTTHKKILLNNDEYTAIKHLGNNLANRSIKGYHAKTEDDVLALQPEDIDLARGMLLSQFPPDSPEIAKYEAILDIMALHVLARTSLNSTAEEKIKETSRFIFEEMLFRFPPESQYSSDIDLYTFLPSVLDSRRGVCLGVSTLYLCIAQRIGLPLEIVTPPGHIFLRHLNTNIETTARGIDIPSETYLSINTKELQLRSIKEVIGLSHFNKGSTWLQRGEYDKASEAYSKAQKYIPDDNTITEFLGYSSILSGKTSEGKKLLESIDNIIPKHLVAKDNTLAADYIYGNTGEEGIKTVLIPVDETRNSIISKQKALEKYLKEYPSFRAGLFALATTWLQLSREREALDTLRHYHALDDTDPIVEYYLAIIYYKRLNYPMAWEHLQRTEELTQARNHYPKALKSLRHELQIHAPE